MPQTAVKQKKRRGRARNGQGHIHLRGNIYHVKLHVSGVKKPVCRTSKDPRRGRDGTKEEHAIALLREIQGLAARGELPEQIALAGKVKPKPDEVTVSQVLDAYRIGQVEAAAKAIEDVDIKIKRLTPYFGERTVASLDVGIIREYRRLRKLDKWQGRNICDATVNGELARLSAALHDAADNQIISHRDIPPIKMVPVKNARQGFLELADLQRFIEAFPWSYRSYVVVKFWTGARSEELLGLRWSQVVWATPQRRGTINLRNGETKNGEGRQLTLVDTAEKVLKERRRWLDDHGFGTFPYVFFRLGHRIDRKPDDPKARPRELGEIREMWNRIAVDLGLQCEGGEFLRPHDLRRSLVRLLDERGELSRDEIRILLGHKTNAMFERYNIHDYRRVERVGEKLAKLSADHDQSLQESLQSIKDKAQEEGAK